MKNINVKNILRTALPVMLMLMMVTTAFANGDTATAGAAASSAGALDHVVSPVVTLINSLMGPALALVGALGGLYCVVLGVKFAKAEEPQEREKAKSHLKNAIIGFVLIFVLLLALNLAMPALETWVKSNQITNSDFKM